ncbi:sporulation protein YabP [Pseudoflavonifractor capillosus]|nr:sporulation protein YabP [Pseudoflavonifractor capillosus]
MVKNKGVGIMAYDDSRLPAEAAHHILLEGREQLTVSGVEEVESFDENTIVMSTVKGTLVVRGEDLHIEKLSLDGGDMKVEGSVDSLTYEDDRRGRGGLLSRLLGG